MSAINKIFPEAKSIDEKFFLFLKTCYEHGWSLRATAKALGIHHTTAKNILEEIKLTDTYVKFLNTLTDQVKDFFDPAFKITIFERYESALKEATEQYKKAKTSGDRVAMNAWFKHIISIQRDMLKATLIANSTEKEKEDIREKYDDLYKEALSKYDS